MNKSISSNSEDMVTVKETEQGRWLSSKKPEEFFKGASDHLKKILDNTEAMLMQLNAEVKNINRGGCGIFALELYKRYKELNVTEEIGFYPLIWPLFSPEAFTEDLNNVISGAQDDFEIPWEHIIIGIKASEFSTVMMDATMLNEERGNNPLPGQRFDFYSGIGNPIPQDHLEILVAKRNIWNKDFNWNDVPRMKELIAQITA